MSTSTKVIIDFSIHPYEVVSLWFSEQGYHGQLGGSDGSDCGRWVNPLDAICRLRAYHFANDEIALLVALRFG